MTELPCDNSYRPRYAYRKVVQIAPMTSSPRGLFALCNDGTMWFLPGRVGDQDPVWETVQEVPITGDEA